MIGCRGKRGALNKQLSNRSVTAYPLVITLRKTIVGRLSVIILHRDWLPMTQHTTPKWYCSRTLG